MKQAPIGTQLDEMRKDADSIHQYYTKEFDDFLKVLRGANKIGKEDFETLLKDESRRELNLGLLHQYAGIVLPHASDDSKIYIVDLLHDLYFSRKNEGFAEEIKVMIVKVAGSISNIEMRKKALLKIREILDEDPCCVEFKTAVEDVIRIDDPDFSWS